MAFSTMNVKTVGVARASRTVGARCALLLALASSLLLTVRTSQPPRFARLRVRVGGERPPEVAPRRRLALLSLGHALQHAAPVAPLVGNPAPEFSATAVFDQEFVDIKLSQYRGK